MANKKSKIRILADVLTVALTFGVMALVPSKEGKILVVLACVAIGLVNYLDGHMEEKEK